MGSHDVTCAVSHLPIQYKEPCRFLFLRQAIAWDDDAEPGNFHHVWAKWLPLSLPVKGLYDSYGRLMAGYREECGEHDSHHVAYDPDALLKFQIESLARVTEPLPEDEMRDGYGDLANFPNTIESLMTACERGWLRVRLPRGTLKDDEEPKQCVLRVSPYYVSERAWQAIVSPPDEKPAIGDALGRLERQRAERDAVDSLRIAIDHYREQREHPRDRERLAEILKSSDMEDEKRKDILDLLGDAFPLMLRGLTPHHEMASDILVVGGDWRPDVRVYESLFNFEDADWKRLADQVFELDVFFSTVCFELRREFYPQLHTDQFYFPDTELLGHRMLARYTEEWCLEIEEEHKREDDG